MSDSAFLGTSYGCSTGDQKDTRCPEILSLAHPTVGCLCTLKQEQRFVPWPQLRAYVGVGQN